MASIHEVSSPQENESSAFENNQHILLTDTEEYQVLDFSKKENINTWSRLPSCDEFVGTRRSKHTAVAYKDSIYVFGGDNGKTMLNDLLRFDVQDNSWGRAFTCGQPPLPRYHHSAVVHESSMFIFGGYTGDINSNLNLTNKNDLFEYKFATGQWSEWRFEESPRARSAHGAAVYNGFLYIFAGYDGNSRLNDMWITPLSHQHRLWTQVRQEGESPPTCCNFPVAVVGHHMYVFSGQSGSKMTNSLFQFDFNTNIWCRISTDHILCGVPWAPPRRYGHTMVSYRQCLYVFGGAADNILPNLLFCYDLECQMWSTVKSCEDSQVPCGRLFHAAAVMGNAMYIFGGTNSDNIRCSEMYRFQFSSYPKCTLHEDYGTLLRGGQLCDVSFLLTAATAGDGSDEPGQARCVVRCHRALVAARSSYLRDKILVATEAAATARTDTSSAEANDMLEIPLENVSHNSFLMILNYMYTDRLNSPGNNAGAVAAASGGSGNASGESRELVSLMVEVYELACRFSVSRLHHTCLYHIDLALSHHNVLTALLEAHRRGTPLINELCLRFIVKEANYSKIILSKEFEDLYKPLMVQIIRRKQEQNPFALTNIPMSATEGGTLEEDMNQFLCGDGDAFCDMTLTLGDDDTVIRAHKPVLAARCGYFDAMFRSFMPRDNTHIKIAIGERELVPSKEAFSSLLRYIYYGDVSMPPEDSMYLFSASHYYGFTNNRLQAFCKHNLEMNVCVNNCLQILEVADKIQSQDMKQHALNIIVKNFPKVAKLNRMRSLSQQLLFNILESLATQMT